MTSVSRLASSAILIVLTCLSVAGCGDRHPSDDEVLTYFEHHRSSLERLVTVFADTSELSSVALDEPYRSVEDDTGEVARRVHEQLSELGLSLVSRDPGTGGIFFALHEVGIGISGASKGLIYVWDLPAGYESKIVPDIDRAFAAAREGQKEDESLRVTYLRPIDGPWFVYFETY